MILAQLEGQPLIRWDWIADHLDDIWARTTEHVALTGIALIVGLVISMGLSLLAVRRRVTYNPITWFAGTLYTIPSLALFAFLVPFTGLSILTAEIGLVSYTLLILIRNIVAGIDGISPAVLEAAYGMGYSSRKAFWEVQMPLAIPVIVAGLRVASVTTVGLVTVTSLIGQGGYGAFILRGLRRDFLTEILVGIVLSVLLAVLLDVFFLYVERKMAPWAYRRVV